MRQPSKDEDEADRAQGREVEIVEYQVLLPVESDGNAWIFVASRECKAAQWDGQS